MAQLLLFVAGALLCNSIPHLVSGLRGERFYTPWSRPRGTGKSSAVENFLWGSFNLFAAAAILWDVWPSRVPHGAIIAAAGFLALGTGLSWEFGRRARAAAK